MTSIPTPGKVYYLKPSSNAKETVFGDIILISDGEIDISVMERGGNASGRLPGQEGEILLPVRLPVTKQEER